MCTRTNLMFFLPYLVLSGRDAPREERAEYNSILAHTYYMPYMRIVCGKQVVEWDSGTRSTCNAQCMEITKNAQVFFTILVKPRTL